VRASVFYFFQQLRFSARALSVPRAGVSGCDGAQESFGQCPQVPEGDVDQIRPRGQVRSQVDPLCAPRSDREYCKEHNCGGKKAANAPELSGKLTTKQIDYARAYPDTERNKYDMLTAGN